jgi:ABC-2 type transport system permease protein
LLIRRDLRNLSQLITPLIIGVIIIFSMTRTGMNEASTPDLIASLSGSFTFYTSLGFVLFVGWSFMLSLTMGAFSREGKNYWMIKTAPIRTRDLLLAKFIVAFIPSLVFEWVLIGAIAFLQRTQPGLLLFGAIIAVFYVAGGVGINLMFGVIGARLDWEDPRRMNSTSMGCLGTIMSFVYLPVSIAFFLIPPVGFSLLNLSVPLGQVIGLVLGGILCLGCAFLPPFLVRKRVERIGLK